MALPGEELLRRPVLVRGIELGRAVDVILDADGERVLGFDVLCGDGRHRFLPMAAAETRPDRIDVRSALTLLDTGQLAFYRERGTSLNVLRADGGGRENGAPGS
jgi:PRC-barrel domain